jgi:anti-sigma factor RsiW
VKCSACRERLPAYQDGVLAAGAAADLEAHLADCLGCRTFAEEMMIAERRLARLSEIEPRADFTLAVMAKIATLPAPVQRSARMWWLAAYNFFAWVALVTLAATGILRWKAITSEGHHVFSKLGPAADVLYRVADHFHLTTIALVGGLVEGLALVILLYLGRRYLAGMRIALFGAQTI